MPPSPLRAAVTVEQVWQPTPGGSGTYVVELTRALGALPDVDPVGIAALHRGGPPADWPLALPVRRAPLPRRALYEAWQRWGRPRAEQVVRGAEVVHATTWAVPPTRLPLVVTVHDLAFLQDPAHFTARGNAYFRRALADVRARARAVVVPSEATADECLAVGLDAERLVVVPHGVTVTEPDPGDVARWRRRTGLDRDYVLWCGTVEPRKGLPTLLAAFARADLPDLDLVLVGPPGWGRLPEVPAGLDPSRVRVLGHLARADLDRAYAGARAFCFPSIREGFGLPVLEAMRHGVPVVTSAGTACAEVAGSAALLAAPGDVAAFAEALREATGARHSAMSAASRERATRYSWARAARATADVYARVR